VLRAHWHIVFDDQPRVREFARESIDRLGGIAELTATPIEWLHLTLQSIGTLTPEQKMRLVADARAALATFPPLEIELGAARVDENTVLSPVSSAGRIDALRGILRGVTECVTGARLSTPMRPHVTYAYSAAEWDAGALARELASVPAVPVQASVARIELVDQRQLWRDRYDWTVIGGIELGGVPPQPKR
jgi:2'-5' RNA ligase